MTGASWMHWGAVLAAGGAGAGLAGALGMFDGVRAFAVGTRQRLAASFPWIVWTAGANSIALCFGITAGAAATLAMMLAGPVAVLPACLAGCCLGHRLLATREKHLRERFAGQLATNSARLAESVRSSLSLPQAIASVAGDAPAPSATVFQAIASAYGLGQSLPQALRQTQARTQSREFAILCEALVLCLERGGPLPIVLERIAASLRELERLRAKIRSGTAGALLAIRVMTATPIVVLGFLWTVDPRSIEKLFQTWGGIGLLSASGLLIGLAMRWSRRIIEQYV
ncbi:MAG: type II secretion system F family protein [Planctomycetota bacterium]